MVETVLTLVDRKDFSFDRHFVVVQPGRNSETGTGIKVAASRFDKLPPRQMQVDSNPLLDLSAIPCSPCSLRGQGVPVVQVGSACQS